MTIEDLTAAGVTPRQAAKVLARLQGRSSRDIYQERLRAKRGSDSES
jgi:hypothetical protein